MKRLIAITAMVLLAASTAASAAGLGFGARAGLNTSNFYGDDSEGLEWMSGFVGGVFMNYSFTPVFGLQPEVLYVMNGAKDSEGDAELKFKVHYIQIPVLARVELPLSGTLLPVLYAGPYIGLNVSSKVEACLGSLCAEVDIKDYTKSTDFGFVLGGGFEAGLGAGTLALDIRYVVGTTGIDDGIAGAIDEELSGYNADLKNQSFMVTAGFSF